MTQKDTKTMPADEPERTGSAPELPHEIAKQYGLHHEPHNIQAEKSEKSVTAEDPEPTTSVAENPDKVIEDPKTDAAVDDILNKEGDDLLAMQDAQHAGETVPKKRSFWGKVKHFLAAWWSNKWARWITIVVLLLAVIIAAVVPKARYAVLNTFGVRSSASVVVLDNTTQLPLKNVTVSLNNKDVRTDSKGVAKFQKLKLGDYKLKVERLAFASQDRDVTIGWGSNPLGIFKLRATGIQYTLSAKDYLSGKPVEGAEAANDDLTALSDENGKIILTVEDTEQTTLSVSIRAAGYRAEALTIDANQTTTANVRLVPAGKTVYVSQQSGTYDLFVSDLDRKNRKLLLAGTGNENDNMSLVMSPDGRRAALTATRETQKDRDGFRLYGLTIVDTQTGSAVTIDYAQQIQLVSWAGDRIVYRKTIASESAANSRRSRIISFDLEKNSKTQLASANQFTMTLSAGGAVYYAPSSNDPQAILGLYRVDADGKNRKRISNLEVWTGLRTAYNTLHLQTPDSWYAYSISSDEFTKTSRPGDLTSYVFVDGPNASNSAAWTDIRDGRGTLHLYDVKKSTNKTLISRDGLTGPIRWAGGKALIFRMVTGSESADYAISPDGGKAHKIADVTATRGFSQ
jgi:hypothetical protein